MSNLDSFYAKWSPTALSILRIVAAFIFITYGTQKLFDLPSGGKPGMFPAPVMSLMGIAGLLELIGGSLLLLGLFTRPVAFILSGEMAVAYFMQHAPKDFLPLVNQGVAAVLFCFIFLYLAVAGGGPLSIDHLWRKSRAARFERT